MSTVIDLFESLWDALGCVGELLGYLLRFVSVFFRTRASLAARLLAPANGRVPAWNRRRCCASMPAPDVPPSARGRWMGFLGGDKQTR